MKKNWITIAGALAVATFAAFAFAAPNDRGGGNPPPHPVDDEAYPSSCNGATLVRKVVCPAMISYNETTSAAVNGAIAWNPTTTTKPASYTNVVVGGPTNKLVSCVYTSDGVDRMSMLQNEPKACVMSKKFRGANCCS